MIVELKIKGSVRVRPDGRLEYRSVAFGSIYGKTKEEIEDKLKEKLNEEQKKHEKLEEKRESLKKPLLSEFFEKVYIPYKERTVCPASVLDIKYAYRTIERSDFIKPLDKYTTANIEEFLFSIEQTRKRKKLRGVINNIFGYAKRMGIIKNNPCDLVEQVKHEQKIGEALSFKEQLIFFNNLFNHGSVDRNVKLYFAFVYLTGTRRNEALNVRVEDIDLENNILHIKGTKTKGSNRIIPLFPLAKKILLSIEPTNGKYFTMTSDYADRTMQKIKDNTHHPHELRHTFGTIKMCVEKLDPKTVSLYMGHTTTDMTLSRYTHPEQLNKGIFYNGSLTENEKLLQLKIEYEKVLKLIEEFLQKI